MNIELLATVIQSKKFEKIEMEKLLDLHDVVININFLSFLGENSCLNVNKIELLTQCIIMGLLVFTKQVGIHSISSNSIPILIENIGIETNNKKKCDRLLKEWYLSNDPYDFYKKTIELIKYIKFNNKKINALTIISDVILKSKIFD